MKTILIVVGLAAGAWLLYSWYQGRSGGSGTGQLGTNLNSVAPELIGGSTGPNSGLTYNAGAINLYYTAPISQSASSTTTSTTTVNKPTVPSVPKGNVMPWFGVGGFRK